MGIDDGDSVIERAGYAVGFTDDATREVYEGHVEERSDGERSRV